MVTIIVYGWFNNMTFLPLLALLIIPTQSSAFIDKIVRLASQPARGICRMLGDTDHANDRSNNRSIIKSAVKKRVETLQDREDTKPLTIYVEDPTVHPETEKIFLKKGVLPGLVKELNDLHLPKHTIVKNFDESKYANCALKWLNPQSIPYALKDAPHLKDYTFSQVIDEMDQGVRRSEKRITNYLEISRSHWIKENLTSALAQIKTDLDRFKTTITTAGVSLSDSILNTGIKLFSREAVSNDECKAFAKNKSSHELEAILHEGSESSTLSPAIAQIQAWYNPSSVRAMISKPLYDASVTHASSDAFFSIEDTKGDSALIAGSTHTDDVSGWMLNTGEWTSQPADYDAFSDNWLLNASVEELEAAYPRS